jgi:hypothetical protein
LREEVVNYGFLDHLELGELLALPFFLFIVFSLAYAAQRRNVLKNPSYNYFARGIMAKLVGATVFCFVYVYYYHGGDTFSYFESSRSFVNLLEQNPSQFFQVFLGDNTPENYSCFDNFTGLPHGNIFFEHRGFFMTKFLTPFILLGFKSYLLSTLLLAVASFSGIWRMYQVLYKYYPALYKPLVIGFVFLPTAVFWGSGMLKDTVTFSGFCWFVSSMEKCFISREKRFKNLILAILFGYIVLIVKPYIIMASIPGVFVWLLHARVKKIRNDLIRVLAIPLIYVISIAGGAGIMSLLGDKLDKFSLDKVLDTANVASKDLKREEYQGHSFDLGDYDVSVQGVIKKFPEATIAGLFRPFIWESKNFVMLLSGVENLALLYLSLFPLFRVGPRKVLRFFFDQPLMLFIFSYSILFAFSIGISTSNFGALIRFKIAFAPFFASMLLVLYNDKQAGVRKANASSMRWDRDGKLLKASVPSMR